MGTSRTTVGAVRTDTVRSLPPSTPRPRPAALAAGALPSAPLPQPATAISNPRVETTVRPELNRPALARIHTPSVLVPLRVGLFTATPRQRPAAHARPPDR